MKKRIFHQFASSACILYIKRAYLNNYLCSNKFSDKIKLIKTYINFPLHRMYSFIQTFLAPRFTNKQKRKRTKPIDIVSMFTKRSSMEIFIPFSLRDFSTKATKLLKFFGFEATAHFCMQTQSLYRMCVCLCLLSIRAFICVYFVFFFLNGFNVHNTISLSSEYISFKLTTAIIKSKKRWYVMYSQFANSANGLNTWTITSIFETSHR